MQHNPRAHFHKTRDFTRTFLIFLALMLTLEAHAQWTSKGPYGGKVTTLHVQDSLVWVGTLGGGIYRNTDATMTAWRYYNYDGLTHGHITAITSIGTKVIAGTDQDGIFISTDFGNTWSPSNTGLLRDDIDALITTSDKVILATGNNIYVSSDSGATWVASPVFLASHVTDFTQFDGICASTSGAGIYNSTDNGVTWTVYQNNTGLTDLAVTAMTCQGTNNLFAATPSGIFAINSSGSTWNLFNTGMPTNNVHHLRYHAWQDKLYASTDQGVFQSSATLIYWTPANTGFTGDVAATAFANGRAIAGSSEKGIFKSTSQDTILWAAFNQGFNNLTGRAIYNDGNLVLAATNWGFYVSKDLAANYAKAHNGLTDSLGVNCIAFWGPDLYVGTDTGGVFMSPDTGQTWTDVNTGLPIWDIVAIAAADSFFLCALANGEVYKLSPGGTTWTLTTGIGGGAGIDAMVTEGNTAFLINVGDGVYKSTDGATWTAFSTGLTNTDVTSLALHNNYLYAGTYGDGIFRTGTSTANWSTVNTGLAAQDILSLCAAGPWVAAGYKGGVQVTYDNGANWYSPDSLRYLPEFAEVYGIHFTANSTRIFAATQDNSFYSIHVQELPLAIANPRADLGTVEFWPNPTAGKFIILLKDVKARVESVSILDPSGRLIHQAQVKGLNPQLEMQVSAAPGIYLVQVQTVRGNLVRRLVIE